MTLKKSKKKKSKTALVDTFISVINEGRESADVQAALLEVLSLFILQNSDKPYEVLETVIEELRDSFYDEADRGLDDGSLTVTSPSRLGYVSGR